MGIEIVVLGAGLAAIGCSSSASDSSDGPRVCTLIGCEDSFSASVRSADGSFPSGMHRVEVLADGATLTCTFTFPADPATVGGVVSGTCSSGLTVMVTPVLVCIDTTTEAGVVHMCDQVPGQFVESIAVTGTPGQVHAWQYVDDVAILDAATAPTYQENRPNGPGCGPVCRQASISWTLM